MRRGSVDADESPGLVVGCGDPIDDEVRTKLEALKDVQGVLASAGRDDASGPSKHSMPTGGQSARKPCGSCAR